MIKLLLAAAGIILYPVISFSQHFSYSDSWNNEGFNLVNSSSENTTVNFSIQSWTLGEVSINRELMQNISLPGHFLPNDEGMPDLPGSGRYIAIPQGSTAHLNIISMQTEILTGINIAPAPRIPKTTDNEPLQFAKNEAVYNSNDFYPADPIKLSEPTQIRGVDAVMLGITPFQYNPVTKELKVIRNLEVEIVFEGGNGLFGDDRLRSRWWDPLLADMFLNYDQVALAGQSPVGGHRSAVAGHRSAVGGQRDFVGYEYLIISPQDATFLAWADTISRFRNRQGILTGIVTTAEIGGNSVAAIESYINNAYNTWEIPPAAILILGDYGTTGATVISPIWDNYCASDNIFADVNNDDLPDIVIARIMAQNATHLETMINKFIGYETNPPVDTAYYNHPVTALGWQTERWFQVCIEVVGGFFRNVLGKDPVRVNAVYDGNPNSDPWSTAPNTSTVMNYFGPNGLGYIPSSPSALGGWSGGNANQINAALNEGSFLLLHRDHGFEQGWGEPAYSNGSMSGLDNENLTFVYSVNCLTGKFNYSGECFAESFYRRPQRAYGIIAASEVSYSFVNDTYVWGAFDNMWPEFMPSYGSTPAPRGLLPAFSNAAGKFFLEQSGWPYNTGNKEVTYHLFHHFGDAFSTLYSEVPQELLVVHNDVVMGASPTFTVQADTLSFIALSVDGQIIGTAEGTGSPVEVSIIPQLPGTLVDIIVTKTNYFRYETSLDVISPNSPYVVYSAYDWNDDNGNNDGLLDYAETGMLSLTISNIGNILAENVNVVLSSADTSVTITDNLEYAGTIQGNQSIVLPDAFTVDVADNITDGQMVSFQVTIDDGDSTWYSDFYIQAHAPVLEFISYTINDEGGNNNGRIDPGENADIHVNIANNGSSAASGVETALSCTDSWISVNSSSQISGIINAQENSELVFNVTADAWTPGGFNATFSVDIQADHDRTGNGLITCVIGQYTALVLDLDPNNNSAPLIMDAFGDVNLIAEYTNSLPSDLSIYKSIFLCLGIYYSSHELTDAEAGILADYLENGGNIYMEGRLTWFVDDQTILHPMFNINTEESEWYEYEKIYGTAGTMTETMDFGYEMINPYNNHFLHAVSPAYEILIANDDSRALMVAYDAGDYKTIGSALEFGGLVDGEFPSSKKELLSRILEFFGEIITGTEDNAQKNAFGGISVYPNPFTSEVVFSLDDSDFTPLRLEISDISGRRIFNTDIDSPANGMVHYTWKPDSGLKPGTYFYRIISGNEIFTGKLMLIN